jgi:hypothetical protein
MNISILLFTAAKGSFGAFSRLSANPVIFAILGAGRPPRTSM